MGHIALVTGDAFPHGFTADSVAAVDAPLVDALEDRNMQVSRPSWRDSAVDWSIFDLALVRTTWDYIDVRDAFIDWSRRVAQATQLWNPAEVLRWNTHKGYLIELEDRGAPIVPTAWIAQGDRINVAELAEQRGWTDVVVKPTVDSGARQLVRSTGGHLPPAQQQLDTIVSWGDAMVQPYLPAIEQHGEWSVIVVDGEVTHIVRKRPAAGEFRVQSDYGGVYELVERQPDVERLARWVVQATGHDLLVARVDVMTDGYGGWYLVELEATEPDLYLHVAPRAAQPLAQAIADRVTG